MKGSRIAVCAIAVVVAVSVGGAFATTPADTQIHACAAPATAPVPGQLTMAAADGSCPAGDTPVAWQTGGPPGPQGPEGPDGPDAAPGPTGPPGPDGHDANDTSDAVTYRTVDETLSGPGAAQRPLPQCSPTEVAVGYGYGFGNIDSSTYWTTHGNDLGVYSNSSTDYFSYGYSVGFDPAYGSGASWPVVTDPAAAQVDNVPSHQTTLQMGVVCWRAG